MLDTLKMLFFICAVSRLEAKTILNQEELKDGLDSNPNDWSHIKWSSIFKQSSTFPNNCENKDLDELRNKSKVSERDEECSEDITDGMKFETQEELSRDEVFLTKTASGDETSRKGANLKNSKASSSQDSNLKDNGRIGKKLKDSSKVDKRLGNAVQNVSKPTKSTSVSDSDLINRNFDSVERVSTSPHKRHPRSISVDTQSFIFNPGARPQEQFQNCTTPKNESGRCRYLQHCMIPNIVSSLSQFMGYVCIINRSFIGVCCPNEPATILVIQEQKEQNETKASNGTTSSTECGVATNTRIVGGSKADPKAWPWMVALFKKATKGFFCGGALINERYVLTAAHCTFNIPNNEIIARLGEYDFKDDGNVHDDYDVIEIKRHGHYSTQTLKNDIALLKLEKPVVFTPFIHTICFPEEEKSYVGENATLAGWGNVKGSFIGSDSTSNVLQEATFPIVSNDECAEKHGLSAAESVICSASVAADKGACNGDSGGPLMLLDKNDRWKVIGVVSWGRRGCSPQFPTVYSRVSHFLEWIKKHSKV